MPWHETELVHHCINLQSTWWTNDQLEVKKLNDEPNIWSCIYPALLSISQVARHESIAILSRLVQAFPNHPHFITMSVLLDKDVEVDFFENIRHIQVSLFIYSFVLLHWHVSSSRLHTPIEKKFACCKLLWKVCSRPAAALPQTVIFFTCKLALAATLPHSLSVL